ncbi:alpha/beta fold hydrolase [Pseudomonas sp. ANT_H12B]|uniref:alpha/beta fold hydrolase n=1 Tax=Pseudomonas sp. ANT_H12B TaxID=2597348 RepID=UPI002116B1F8|nr:alpha/beta hydrolase [Pseudomonas sp. ANT_H12B]
MSWHKIAPRLAKDFTVVCTDLRGYGDSSKPEGGAIIRIIHSAPWPSTRTVPEKTRPADSGIRRATHEKVSLESGWIGSGGGCVVGVRLLADALPCVAASA